MFYFQEYTSIMKDDEFKKYMFVFFTEKLYIFVDFPPSLCLCFIHFILTELCFRQQL